MSKFTEAPWIVGKYPDEVFSATADRYVAQTCIYPDVSIDEVKANTRLIAAAPKMYDILTRINKFYSRTIIKCLLLKDDRSVKISEIAELLARIDGDER